MAGWGLVKVAMLTDCYPPRLGGIESQVRDLSRQLVRAGHEVEVFTATAGPHGERGGHTATGDDGVTVHRLAIPLPGGIPVNPFAPREVRRRLAAGRFDVAHAHLGVVSPFATDLVPVALEAGPAGDRHLPLRDRPLVAGVFRTLGHLVALGRARRRPQRGVDDGGRPGVRRRPRRAASRSCPTAWMPRGGVR